MPDAECEKLKADKTKDGIAEVDVAARKVRRILPGGSDPEQFDILTMDLGCISPTRTPDRRLWST